MLAPGFDYDGRSRHALYDAWIDRLLARTVTVYGHCRSVCLQMQREFTELTLVPGHVESLAYGVRSHWWLVAPDGGRVDPTLAQFPGGVLSYAAWTPGDCVRVGTCLSCAAPLWRQVMQLTEAPCRPEFCNDTCRSEFGRSLNVRKTAHD